MAAAQAALHAVEGKALPPFSASTGQPKVVIQKWFEGVTASLDPEVADPGIGASVEGSYSFLLHLILDQCRLVGESVNASRKAQEDQEGRIKGFIENKSYEIQEAFAREFRMHQLWAASNFQRLEMAAHGNPAAGVAHTQADSSWLHVQPTGLHRRRDPAEPTALPLSRHPPLSPTEFSMSAPSSRSIPDSEPPAAADQSTAASRFGIDSGGSVSFPAPGVRNSETESHHTRKYIERMKTQEKGSGTIALIKDNMEMNWQYQIKDFSKKPENQLVPIVESSNFSAVSMMVIIANAGWIGYTTDWHMKDRMDHAVQTGNGWWDVVRAIFTICFTVELIVRMIALRSSFWFRKDWAWNSFDTIVVCASLSELVIPSLNASFWRTMRVIRIVRIARIRKLRFFFALRKLTCAIMDSCWFLFWLGVVLFFITYVVAILILQGIMHSEADVAHLQSRWGSVSAAMVSLCMAMSGGIAWGVLADELNGVGYVIAGLLFVYVNFIIFGVVNVATGVFVERVFEMKQRDHDLAIHHEMSLTREFFKELRGLLLNHGLSDDERFTMEVLQENMERHDVQMFLQTHNIDAMVAHELFILLDVDDTGTIGIDDFVYGCQRLKGHAKGVDMVLLFEVVYTVQRNILAARDRNKAFESSLGAHIDHINAEVREMRGDLAELLADSADRRPSHTTR